MKNESLRRNFRPIYTVGIAAGLLLGACSNKKNAEPDTATTIPAATTETPTTTMHPTTTTTETHFKGGCARFIIFGQNNQDPLGAAVRAEPNPGSEKIGSIAPNETVGVDGWVHGGVAPYPENPEPYNNDVYYHVASLVGGREAWVSFPGTRSKVTQYDPTLIQDKDAPSPLDKTCEGEYIP